MPATRSTRSSSRASTASSATLQAKPSPTPSRGRRSTTIVKRESALPMEIHPDWTTGDLMLVAPKQNGQVGFMVNSNVLVLSSSWFRNHLHDRPASIHLPNAASDVENFLALLHHGRRPAQPEPTTLTRAQIQTLYAMCETYLVTEAVRKVLDQRTKRLAEHLVNALGATPTRHQVLNLLDWARTIECGEIWMEALCKPDVAGWSLLHHPYGITDNDRQLAPGPCTLLLETARVCNGLRPGITFDMYCELRL